MITVHEAKSLARELSRSGSASHSRVLEAVAHAAGLRDWNTFVALAPPGPPAPNTPPDAVARQQVVPVLRMFDVALARSFYCDFLGFTWEWQHQELPGHPVYAQLQRDGSVLHLSEHHGDATPGSGVLLVVADLDGYRQQLLARQHPGARPGIEHQPWGGTMTVADPFGNRLTFWQRPTR